MIRSAIASGVKGAVGGLGLAVGVENSLSWMVRLTARHPDNARACQSGRSTLERARTDSLAFESKCNQKAHGRRAGRQARSKIRARLTSPCERSLRALMLCAMALVVELVSCEEGVLFFLHDGINSLVLRARESCASS